MDATEQEKLEKRQELEEQVEAMRAVAETIKTAGWQKYLVPRFERLKQTHKHSLMNAKEMPDVIRAQEGIKSIDMLLEDINDCIQEGEEAVQILTKEKD